jgi:hypothetical protein
LPYWRQQLPPSSACYSCTVDPLNAPAHVGAFFCDAAAALVLGR